MKRNRVRFPVGLMLLGFLAMGCAQKTPVLVPSVIEQPLPPVEILPYRLQVGDTISIKFWGNPELDEEIVIRPDGRISLPFIDEVAAANLTPPELDAELTRLYTGELAEPEITIIVRAAGGQQVYFGGEVGSAGLVDLSPGLTIFQGLQQAGGLLTTARRREAVLIRTYPDGSRVARSIDLRPIVTGQDPGADLPLMASDIVYVPRTKIENFALFVEQYVNPIYGLLPIRVVGTVRLFDESNEPF